MSAPPPLTCVDLQEAGRALVDVLCRRVFKRLLAHRAEVPPGPLPEALRAHHAAVAAREPAHGRRLEAELRAAGAGGAPGADPAQLHLLRKKQMYVG